MYVYKDEKINIFSETGQVMFLKIRDRVNYLLKESGSFMMQNAIQGSGGSSWFQLACVDRLVELDEIEELKCGDVAGQHRVFVRKNGRRL